MPWVISKTNVMPAPRTTKRGSHQMTRSFETTCLFRFRSANNTGVKIETRATAAQMKVIGSITVRVYAEGTGKHGDQTERILISRFRKPPLCAVYTRLFPSLGPLPAGPQQHRQQKNPGS